MTDTVVQFYEGPMTMTPVESSQLAAIGYDPASLTLGVTFKGGGHYRYAGMSPEHYAEFMAADSKGSHFGKFVRDRYQYRKLAQVDERPESVRSAVAHLESGLASLDEMELRTAVREALADLGSPWTGKN